MDKDKLIETFDNWKGRNHIYFDGKCISGPNGIKYLSISISALLIYLILFIFYQSKVPYILI